MKILKDIRHSLAVRLLKIVFSIYLCITVLITLAQMLNEYYLEEMSVKQNLLVTQSIFEKNLAGLIWDFEHEQLLVTAQGILKLPDIVGIKIFTDNNEPLVKIGQITNKNNQIILKDNKHTASPYLSLFTHKFVLQYEQEKNIGHVVLYSSNEIVFDKVKYNFLVIIINSIIKTIILWLLFIWAFNKFLTKQLDIFCHTMETVDIDNANTSFLSLNTFNTHELSRIEHFFNDLLNRIVKGREQLDALNKTLEEKVISRTQELSEKSLQLEKLNDEKSEFLAMAAHDLKNPSIAITSFAQLIDILPNTQENQEKLQKYTQCIEKSAIRMTALIDNLLDIEKIESGNTCVSLKQIDILSRVDSVILLNHQQAKAKGITLTLTTTDTHYTTLTDECILLQILDNLISNAIKYSPINAVVDIRLIKKRDKIRIEVQNQGQGLTAKDQERLFMKFGHLSTRPTADEYSTGLGLYIAQNLAALLKTQIHCFSIENQGATFSFELLANIEGG